MILDNIKKERFPMAAYGLSHIHKAVVASALRAHTKRKTVLLTYDEASAFELTDNLQSLGNKVLMLPSRDYNLNDFSGYSREYEYKRELFANEAGCWTAYCRYIIHRVCMQRGFALSDSQGKARLYFQGKNNYKGE